MLDANACYNMASCVDASAWQALRSRITPTGSLVKSNCDASEGSNGADVIESCSEYSTPSLKDLPIEAVKSEELKVPEDPVVITRSLPDQPVSFAQGVDRAFSASPVLAVRAFANSGQSVARSEHLHSKVSSRSQSCDKLQQAPQPQQVHQQMPCQQQLQIQEHESQPLQQPQQQKQQIQYQQQPQVKYQTQPQYQQQYHPNIQKTPQPNSQLSNELHNMQNGARQFFQNHNRNQNDSGVRFGWSARLRQPPALQQTPLNPK